MRDDISRITGRGYTINDRGQQQIPNLKRALHGGAPKQPRQPSIAPDDVHMLGIAVEATKELVNQCSKQCATPIVCQNPKQKKCSTRSPEYVQALHYYCGV